MYTEAMSTYHAISKNKFLAQGAKVKTNMGNIYVKHNNLTKAIKMYRMAMANFWKQRELAEPTEILKSFEKKETKVATSCRY